MRSILMLITCVVLVPLLPEAQAQTYLNLDFEESTPDGKPKNWYAGGAGYEVRVDTTTVYSGAKSLYMRWVKEGQFGVATSTFPLEEARGKTVRYSGYIKTDSVTDGYAGLWWRVDGENRAMLAFDNMSDRGPRGTTPWTRYEIELNVDSSAININFGVLMPGRGEAWFDGLQVELDGVVYEQVAPARFVSTEEQLDWIHAHAVPFDRAEPGQGWDDLMPLKEIVGDARIVALGEGTHGTREFFQMKHRITEFLANEMGFTVFAIEANMPEARQVNRYVLTGEGDPKKALAGMYFWTWNTQEVLDMIEWMRAFNASGQGRIAFWGFDMQTPDVAMDSVRSFVDRRDPTYAETLAQAYEKVDEILQARRNAGNAAAMRPFNLEPSRAAAQQVLNYLEAQHDQYLQTARSMEVAWAIQNARIVVQGAEAYLPGKASRDESMAANIDWILDHEPPDTKIVLWAHNLHVTKASTHFGMGRVLDERHGDDQVVFGFAFHEGTYTARGPQGLQTYSTSSSEAGSVEWALHQTGLPRFVLDVRRASEDEPGSAWLHQQLEFRNIGAMAMDYAFSPTVVAEHYDALIFFDQSHPSVLLDTPRPRPGD